MEKLIFISDASGDDFHPEKINFVILKSFCNFALLTLSINDNTNNIFISYTRRSSAGERK